MNRCGILLLSIILMFAGCRNARDFSSFAPKLKATVTAYGAVADGKTLNTQAFQKALDACAQAGGGEVIVPAGEYLIGSVVIGSNTTLRLEKDATIVGSPNADDYPLMNVRWEGRWREGHRALIHAKDATNIAIVGEGKIQGDLNIGNLRNPRGPCIFEPIECKHVRLEGISINYRRMWAMHLTYCDDVHVKDLTIRSTRNNGDGIDIDSCRNVRIEKCDIDAGDDAIVLKSGRGMEAVRIARPTENVTVEDCRLGSDFAGFAIGTEMSGGVRNVKFSNCTFTRGANAIFIKSRTGRGGFIENVEGTNLKADGAKAFLRIDLVTKGIQDSEPVPGDDAFPAVKNLRFSHLTGSCDVLLDAANITSEKPVENLSFEDVNVQCKKAIVLHNITNAVLKNIKASGYSGEFVTIQNVTGPRIDTIKSPPDTQ
jgi:polygalacturonase